MSKDDESDRKLHWTEMSKKDIKELMGHGLQKSDVQRVAAGLRLVASLEDVCDHPFVERLRMCDTERSEDLFRWKHQHLTIPVRVLFEVDDQYLTVWAVLERDWETYGVAKNFLVQWMAGLFDKQRWQNMLREAVMKT